jgi:hypothetical protein
MTISRLSKEELTKRLAEYFPKASPEDIENAVKSMFQAKEWVFE